MRYSTIGIVYSGNGAFVPKLGLRDCSRWLYHNGTLLYYTVDELARGDVYMWTTKWKLDARAHDGSPKRMGPMEGAGKGHQSDRNVQQ